MIHWRTIREEGEVLGIYRTLPLSKGFRLRIDATWFERDGEAEIAMMAYRGRFKDADAGDKEGQATGPGGLEVFGKAMNLLIEAETEVTRRYGSGTRIVIVAATERLHKIYAARLSRLGYHEFRHPDYSSLTWPALIKEV